VLRHLKHRNIVPFLGITSDPLQLISEWMPGGVLTEHLKEHPDANLTGFVGAPPVVLDSKLTPTTSYLTSLAAFTISTPAT